MSILMAEIIIGYDLDKLVIEIHNKTTNLYCIQIQAFTGEIVY